MLKFCRHVLFSVIPKYCYVPACVFASCIIIFLQNGTNACKWLVVFSIVHYFFFRKKDSAAPLASDEEEVEPLLGSDDKIK